MFVGTEPKARLFYLKQRRTVKSHKHRVSFKEKLNMYVRDLDISTRSSNGLRMAGIVTIEDLIRHSDGDIRRLPNLGRNSVKEIKRCLSEMGLHLGMRIERIEDNKKTIEPVESKVTLIPVSLNDLEEIIKRCVREVLEEIKSNEPNINHEVSDRTDIYGAVEETGLSKSKLYKLTMEGKIPSRKFGKQLVFSRKELKQWVENNTTSKRDIKTEVAISLAKQATRKINNK